MNTARSSRNPRPPGFTLVEMLIAVTVFAIVAIVIGTVLYGTSRSKATTSSLLESSQLARGALDLMSRDIRSAGYGTDQSYPGTPQPAIAYVDSAEIIIATNLNPYPDTTNNVHSAPLALDPAGSPVPRPLVSSSYTPPAKYRTGAELVRYTLDLNDDGVVDAGDVATTAGRDAAVTPNPNDFVLVRQVYGDSTGGSAGDNGGAQERVALVRKPGGGVPALFTVYFHDSATPWDWASGAVPANRLADIERVEVRVTATSGKPDGRGQYPTTTMQAQVNTLRNTPDFGAKLYAVDGYVYEDLNRNHSRDTGEPGIANATVRAGNQSVAYTSSSGYYRLRVPAGTYTLRHFPPEGYGSFSSPDTFGITVPPATSRLFADTSRAGGWVNAHVWRDEDGDGVEDVGEVAAAGIALTLTPGLGTPAYTDGTGNARLFASTGGYSLAVTVPDSMAASTPNPVSGTMTNGGSTSHAFGLRPSLTGQVSGKVFRDNNRNGSFDAGEPGMQNVWVGVTKDGINIAGYAYTDASGNYTIRVPINDPPHTQQYFAYSIPPAGYYPTSATAIGGIWVQNAATVSGKNFGIVGYQIITLNASRVLSLASADMIEKDWNGNQTQNAHRDRDLVLGADAGGADNVSVWFNQYNGTPLFSPDPDYKRLAPESVLGLVVDTLDTGDPVARPDVVTGTRRAATGNFFVWLNQNTSGNYGILPASFSPGLNYLTQDAGDVQAVLTADVAGNNMPDIIVGTKSPTSGRGTFEVWTNSGGTSPTFTRDETYPNAGSIPGNAMGEVTAMALADFDRDGDRDLVVGTKTGTYAGELLIFSFDSKVTGGRFRCRAVQTLYSDAVTSLAVADPNGDGWPDLIVGTQYASNRGHLQQWRNDGSLVSWSFTKIREVDAQGIVMSLAAADLGGGSTNDIAVGWRQNDTSYGGGVEIYYMDLGVLPGSGVDPSGGSVINMTPALTAGDFDWGLNPTKSPPYLTDLAAGVKASSTTGALVVFIR